MRLTQSKKEAACQDRYVLRYHLRNLHVHRRFGFRGAVFE